jgi:hypothetical protein
MPGKTQGGTASSPSATIGGHTQVFGFTTETRRTQRGARSSAKGTGGTASSRSARTRAQRTAPLPGGVRRPMNGHRGLCPSHDGSLGGTASSRSARMTGTGDCAPPRVDRREGRRPRRPQEHRAREGGVCRGPGGGERAGSAPVNSQAVLRLTQSRTLGLSHGLLTPPGPLRRRTCPAIGGTSGRPMHSGRPGRTRPDRT